MANAELIAIGALGIALMFSLWQLMNKSDSDLAAELRKELREMNIESTEALGSRLEGLGKAQQEHLAAVSDNIEKLKEGNEKKLDQMRETVDEKL